MVLFHELGHVIPNARQGRAVLDADVIPGTDGKSWSGADLLYTAGACLTGMAGAPYITPPSGDLDATATVAHDQSKNNCTTDERMQLKALIESAVEKKWDYQESHCSGNFVKHYALHLFNCTVDGAKASMKGYKSFECKDLN